MTKLQQQQKRNFAWHKKHTVDLAQFKEKRKIRLYNYTHDIKKTVSTKVKDYSKGFKEKSVMSLWSRVKMFFKRLFTFNKYANA